MYNKVKEIGYLTSDSFTVNGHENTSRLGFKPENVHQKVCLRSAKKIAQNALYVKPSFQPKILVSFNAYGLFLTFQLADEVSMNLEMASNAFKRVSFHKSCLRFGKSL
eukprot:snap_masked-scaffold_1-processed-gene-7.5-mRNA-1 protein AED:1.00 eAED:1.00 QI:0/0/0/0/1/1/2/0/107